MSLLYFLGTQYNVQTRILNRETTIKNGHNIWDMLYIYAGKKYADLLDAPYIASNFCTLTDMYIGHNILYTIFWSQSIGHNILDIIYWTPYIGLNLSDIIYWTQSIGHNILDTIFWTQYMGHSAT